MKKIVAFLVAVCLLCTVFSAFADMEIPKFEDMPAVVIEDENVTVDEEAFFGEWVLNVAFYDTEYVDEQTLSADFGYNFMPYIISKGKVTQDIQQENGEFKTEEAVYAFEAGQLQCVDDEGQEFVVELLEDGNLVMSVFTAGNGDNIHCLSIFLIHPEG